MSQPTKNTVNYLTQQNGCLVIDQSSERERGPASSILSSDQKSLWVTSDKLPQQCTISLKKIIKKPVCYNTIGFYCWHQYDSNPALIQVWVRGLSDKWQLISKVRLSMLDSWQYFKIEDLAPDKVKEVKLKIMENFGDTKTYLNKIGLFYNSAAISKQSLRQQIPLQQQNEQMSPMHPSNLLHPTSSTKQAHRQKTYSEHHNSSSSSSIQLIKQLKKANENIAYLTEQQQKMKKTILRQQNTILKMQQILDTVLTNFNKLSKFKEVDNDRRKYHDEYHEEYSQPEKTGKKSTKKIVKNQEPNRNQIQNFKSMINQFQKQSISKPTNFKKPDTKNSSSSQKYSTHFHDNKNDVIKTNSEDDLSQYTQTQTNMQYRTSQAQYGNPKNSHSKYNSNAKQRQSQKGEQVKMLEKLQKLIHLRELKKKQLKKSSAKRSHGKKQSVYEQSDEQDNIAQNDYYQ